LRSGSQLARRPVRLTTARRLTSPDAQCSFLIDRKVIGCVAPVISQRDLLSRIRSSHDFAATTSVSERELFGNAAFPA